MKVFLSWSGTRSHKVALVFRDWLPSVIQEIAPYVSSEDIDKGARWSTDIAGELSDSTFGILCVTRDNINAPWLNFEAGALSKTMDKAFVSPFLFDIKRSEVDGPILQFQSTIFEKEDLQKLVTTLNKACDKDSVTADRLNKAFEVWFPTLNDELMKLRELEPSTEDGEDVVEIESPKAQEILEEILELSRSNQKLIRNPDGSLGANLHDMSNLLQDIIMRIERLDGRRHQKERGLHPEMMDELMHFVVGRTNGYVGAQMTLALVRSRFPWVYDLGIETINILRSRKNQGEKREALNGFRQVVDLSIEHPVARSLHEDSREMRFIFRRLPDLLEQAFELDVARS